MNSLQNPLNASCPQDVTQKPGENVVSVVYALKDLPDTIDKVKDVYANFSALIRSMRNRYPDMQFSCTIEFGVDAWKRFFPEQGNPRELQPFEETKGIKLTAVPTPGDLLFHTRCEQMGLCLEFASIIDQKLRGAVESIDETHGLRCRDGKAITGFVDGTENPAVDEDSYRFAMIGDENPEFMGGSYVFMRKYIHDMVAWNALPAEEQEKAIGRRKFNDAELSNEEEPKNTRSTVTNTGGDLKIVRANMPFAHTSKGEYGTYFIAYVSTFSTTRRMLENMFVGDSVGNTDRLLDLSAPIAGTLFFVPSYELLDKLGE